MSFPLKPSQILKKHWKRKKDRMSEPLLKYRQPTAPQDILTEAVPAKLYTEGSGLNLARAALFGVELDGVKDIVELLRAYRGGRPNSLIMGGPMGWSWYATLDEAHHGALTGPANAHRHSDLANIGIDDHHARDHATRHDPGEADALSTAYFRTDGSLGLAGDLKPDADATRNIGADLLRWRNLRLSHGALIGGNVGIGTDSPANKLHVVAPIATQFARFSNTYDSGYVLLGGNNNRGRLLLGGGSTGSLLHTTGGWQWDTQLNIMGAVGIGTNSPTTFTLQIAGSTGPNADAVSDLGGVSLRWRDLRLSRDIYMGGTLQSGSMDAARITTGRFGKSRLEWTADKLLKGAGAGADPTEIDVPGGATVAAGTYTGDGTDSRQITVGFLPSMVIVMRPTDSQKVVMMDGHSIGSSLYFGGTNWTAYNYIHASDGFVVQNSDTLMNFDSETYYYWAISE